MNSIHLTIDYYFDALVVPLCIRVAHILPVNYFKSALFRIYGDNAYHSFTFL